MMTLGIDSSAVSVGAAICDGERVIADGFINNKITHSQTLMPLVQSLLENARMTLGDIDVFAVSAGPGSFTGLRIGVSAVKGMAYALGKPCKAVSTLHAMAYNMLSSDGIVCAVMDARCDQVYNALFRIKDGAVSRLCEDRALKTGELKAVLDEKYAGERITLVGDGAELCFSKFGGGNITLSPAPTRYQNGVGVCYASMEYPDIAAAALMPKYLRLPQAERERLAREQAH
jgi:tRNA threonylcarbamoyladenosine biosynthesis protein TsaB